MILGCFLMNLDSIFAQDSIVTDIKDIANNQTVFIDIRDGKKYPIIKIGEQVWMGRNLSYKPDTGKFWIPDENPEKLKIYGYLYNYVSLKNVCPQSWHIPTKDE
jgi:hypothetical protein